MKDFLETKVGRLLLLGIVLVVWGVNVIQFSDVFSSKEEISTRSTDVIDLSSLSLVSSEQFKYKKSVRDPFKSKPEPVRQRPDELNQEVPYQRPRIAVLGVMDQTIMVMDDTRNIIVVKEQEVFNGITVKSITKDSVIFEHESKPFVIKVRS